MEWKDFIKLLENNKKDHISVARAYLSLIDNPEFDEPVAVRHAFELLKKKRPFAASLVEEFLGRQIRLSQEYNYLAATIA